MNIWKKKNWPPLIEEGTVDEYKHCIFEALELIYCHACNQVSVVAVCNTVKWRRALYYGLTPCPRCLHTIII